MSEIITVGLDLAKNVFQAHGADGSGKAVLRKKLRRDQVLEGASKNCRNAAVGGRLQHQSPPHTEMIPLVLGVDDKKKVIALEQA